LNLQQHSLQISHQNVPLDILALQWL
jgi:hypothetical protein